jgi:hypothetical protein
LRYSSRDLVIGAAVAAKKLLLFMAVIQAVYGLSDGQESVGFCGDERNGNWLASCVSDAVAALPQDSVVTLTPS